MNQKAELASIKAELNAIIKEMEGISIGIRNNFKGIGNEKCSESIDSVINRFYQVRKVLNNIKITEKISI